MKCSLMVAAAFLLAMISLDLRQAGAQTLVLQPAAATTQAAPASGVADRNVPLPEIDNISMDDVFSRIHQSIPDFNAVVVRASRVDPTFPTLPKMTLTNVTIGQLMEFIGTAFPGITVRTVDGPQGPLWVVNIEPVAQQPEPASPQSAVQVIHLSNIVNQLSAGKIGDDRQKQAMNDILSLIQAAMTVVGGDAPLLKVHEPTQTLIFKGTSQQQEVLRQALESLGATAQEQIDATRRQMQESIMRRMQDDQKQAATQPAR